MRLSHIYTALVVLGLAVATVVIGHPTLAFAAADSGTQAAGNQIQSDLQGIVGPVFLGFMGVKGVGHFMAHDTPKALGHFGLAAVTAIPIYASGPLQQGLSHVANSIGTAFTH